MYLTCPLPLVICNLLCTCHMPWHLPLATCLATCTWLAPCHLSFTLPIATCPAKCQLPFHLPLALQITTYLVTSHLTLALPLALPHYVIVSSLSLPPPTYTQTSCSAPYPQISAVYGLPLIWHEYLTKAYNNPKQNCNICKNVRYNYLTLTWKYLHATAAAFFMSSLTLTSVICRSATISNASSGQVCRNQNPVSRNREHSTFQ